MIAVVAPVAAHAQTDKFTLSVAGGIEYGRGKVTSVPAGIDCTLTGLTRTGTCSAEFPAGSTVALTATATDGSTFLGWGTDSCPTAGPTCSLEMTRGYGLFARFDPLKFPITVLSGGGNGTGVVRVIAGTSIFTIACPIIRGVAQSQYCSNQIPLGAGVIVSAEPNISGSTAVKSVVGCPTGGTPCNFFFASSPATITVTFHAPAIEIRGAGTGSGRVVGPSEFDCLVSPTGVSGRCSRISDVTIAGNRTFVATPDAGSVFAGWSGLCSGSGSCTTFGDFPPNTQLIATFTRVQVTLTLSGAGTGDGVVTASPGGMNCVITKGAAAPAGCSVALDQNTSVTLTADPQGGSTFGGWQGDACSGSQLTCTLTATQAATVTARFTAPRAAREIALALLGKVTLTADERLQLDRFGNKDGTFNLGDLLALLDRTGEHLTPDALAALVATGRSSSAGSVAAPRRTP